MSLRKVSPVMKSEGKINKGLALTNKLGKLFKSKKGK